MNNFKKIPKILLLTCSILAINHTVYAEKKNAMNADNAPIDVKADYSELDRRKQRAIYRGDVRLERGNMVMEGDELVVTRSANGEITGVLTGKPARANQSASQGQPAMNAEANSIEYIVKAQQLNLLGNAILVRGNDRMTGQSVRYDAKEQRAVAQGNGQPSGRVHIVIYPDEFFDENKK